ncbi:unnamed protein product [Rotaria sp. Silwood1]|nr:unnamed protein product [Rotaria sp. Silwood1]CAF1657653.1 unnamed protein product [Rotaria sp. Silwood1]
MMNFLCCISAGYLFTQEAHPKVKSSKKQQTGVNVNGLADGGFILGGDFVLGGIGPGLAITNMVYIHSLFREKTTGVNVNDLADGSLILGGDFVLGGIGPGLGAFSLTGFVY